MLVGGQRFARHRATFLLVAVVLFCLPAAIWFVSARVGWLPWPSGSGTIGFACGIVAGFIILFEMLIWPRKYWRGRRLGATKWWMFWHIWLGLLSLPLAVCHSGFALGGSLSSLLMIVFLLVIASGVWGLLLQQIIPGKLLGDVPGETIASEIDRVMSQHVVEAQGWIDALSPSRQLTAEHDHEHTASSRTVALSSASRTAQLVTFFTEQVDPYLRHGKSRSAVLRVESRAKQLFSDLCRDLKGPLRDVAQRLEGLCDLRRKLDFQVGP